MIRRFALRASGPLAGAVMLAALALPAAAASAPDLEFSSQMTDRGVPQTRGPGAGPRGPVGAPRHMGGPPRGSAVAPHVGGQRQHFGNPRPQFGGPGGPGFRGQGFGAPGYRGPAVGFRGPGYHRGHAFVRGRHHVRRGGYLLPLVGLGALGAIYVGSRYYTPYAYVDGAVGPECSGPTEDGLCELRLTEVPLESGGAALQCVAYCPQ
jgi:hypothetical protein